MLHSYFAIASALRHIGGLQWIDLDRGQLNNPEGFNSLLVPAVLIEIGSQDFMLDQGGEVVNTDFTLKIVRRLPNETHAHAPNVDDMLEDECRLNDAAIEALREVLDGFVQKTTSHSTEGTLYIAAHQCQYTYYKPFTDPKYTLSAKPAPVVVGKFDIWS